MTSRVCHLRMVLQDRGYGALSPCGGGETLATRVAVRVACYRVSRKTYVAIAERGQRSQGLRSQRRILALAWGRW